MHTHSLPLPSSLPCEGQACGKEFSPLAVTDIKRRHNNTLLVFPLLLLWRLCQWVEVVYDDAVVVITTRFVNNL